VPVCRAGTPRTFAGAAGGGSTTFVTKNEIEYVIDWLTVSLAAPANAR
jgi:hypothetical protein